MVVRNKDPEFVAAFLAGMADEMSQRAANGRKWSKADLAEADTLAKAWRTAATLIRKGVVVDAGNGVAP